MKERIQFASAMITIFYAMISAMQIMLGMTDRKHDIGLPVMRRYEVVAPGYRLGWWIAGPLKRGIK